MVTAADNGGTGLDHMETFQIVVNDLLGASGPTIVVNDGEGQRSRVTQLRVTFDAAVTLGPDAIAVTTEGGAEVDTDVANPGNDGMNYVVTFVGPGAEHGSAPDGNYTLTVQADAVDNGTGEPMEGGDATADFFRFFGDQDGDRDVDSTDYFALRPTLNRSKGDPQYLAHFDFNDDGTVDVDDALAVRDRLGTHLDPPAPPQVASVTVNQGESQRSTVTSLTVTFDVPVATDPDAFVVRDAQGAAVHVGVDNPDGDGRTFALTFGGSQARDGSIFDGYYTLTVRHDHVHADQGAAMSADHVTAFHRMLGDFDGDADFDRHDRQLFWAMWKQFKQTRDYHAALDLDSNGTIDVLDMRQFKGRLLAQKAQGEQTTIL
jgi:hypothetical protein